MNTTNVLFMGYAISRDLCNNTKGASVAGNEMQINLLEYLSNNCTIHSASIFPTATFPTVKECFIKKREVILFDSFKSICVPFFNIPIFKQISQTVSMFLYSNKIVANNSLIITYNLYPQIGIPAVLLKKIYGCNIISILADLPIDDAINRRPISSLLRKMFDYFTCLSIKHADKLIVLNKNVIDMYNINVDYLVIEGGISEDKINNNPAYGKNEKNLLYSGALTEYSGILTLAESMSYVKNQDIVLDIYGSGYLEESIRVLAKQNGNIRFHGLVDHEVSIQKQREAYLLINPRPCDSLISKLTFPSKLLEYMASGTPIITTKLDGIADEYLECLYFFEEFSPAGLASKIDTVMALPRSQIQETAIQAKIFVATNKTWTVQMKKICSFIFE